MTRANMHSSVNFLDEFFCGNNASTKQLMTHLYYLTANLCSSSVDWTKHGNESWIEHESGLKRRADSILTALVIVWSLCQHEPCFIVRIDASKCQYVISFLKAAVPNLQGVINLGHLLVRLIKPECRRWGRVFNTHREILFWLCKNWGIFKSAMVRGVGFIYMCLLAWRIYKITSETKGALMLLTRGTWHQ